MSNSTKFAASIPLLLLSADCGSTFETVAVRLEPEGVFLAESMTYALRVEGRTDREISVDASLEIDIAHVVVADTPAPQATHQIDAHLECAVMVDGFDQPIRRRVDAAIGPFSVLTMEIASFAPFDVECTFDIDPVADAAESLYVKWEAEASSSWKGKEGLVDLELRLVER